MRTDLRRDLATALKSREHAAVRALRSVLAAIDNAEARPVEHAPDTASGHVAGAVAGLGASEAQRRHLTEEDVRAILDDEVRERTAAVTDCERNGRHDHAERLRAEITVLSRYLPAHGTWRA